MKQWKKKHRYRSIGGISYNNIDFNAIEKMEKLKHIVFEKFLYCFMTPDFYVKMCRPRTDGELFKYLHRMT